VFHLSYTMMHGSTKLKLKKKKSKFNVRNLFGGALLDIVTLQSSASNSHICIVLWNPDACRIKDCLWTSRVVCVCVCV